LGVIAVETGACCRVGEIDGGWCDLEGLAAIAGLVGSHVLRKLRLVVNAPQPKMHQAFAAPGAPHPKALCIPQKAEGSLAQVLA
jgi:hypothetical protein